MCIFCRIVSHEIPARIVHQDEHVVAFHDLHPQAPTHLLVIPSRHIEHLQALTPDDATLMGHLMTLIPRLASAAGIDAEGYRLVSNCKQHGGQTVDHLHFHLLGGRPMHWPPG
jgi:histidine triad (HIT) family protein